MPDPHPQPPRPRSAEATCPTDAILADLLADALPASEVARVATHLEQCPACQARLDTLAGAQQILPAAVPRPPAPRSTALAEIMERLSALDPAAASTAELAEPPLIALLAPPQTPGTLGRFAGYDILERIASGGMGVVLKARDPGLDRVVAIKLLAPFLAASDSARTRFLREARAAAAVTHEHVVAIHAVGEERGLPFLVMQFIAGRSLEARLRSGPLTPPQIFRIGLQTAQGLAAAHAQGLIHRDVKPGNILLENGVERVKLTDFGLARAADEPGVTRPGVLAGTPEFMSPEQARGDRLDPRSDLFAFGSVLYLMATGRSPFAADSTLATLRRVGDDHPPRVDLLQPTLPAAFGDLVEDLLQKDPARRPESAEVVATRLTRLLAEIQSGAPASPPSPATTAATPTRPRRGTLVVAVIVLLAMVGMRVAFLRPTGSSSSSPARPETTSRSLASGPAKNVPPLVAARFDLLGDGGTRQSFSNLAAAVTAASAGATIECAFSGRHALDPLRIQGKPLFLRAAEGMHPVLENRSNSEVLLGSDSLLILEGLELRAANADADLVQDDAPIVTARRLLTRRMREMRESNTGAEPALIQMRGGELWLANCRLATASRHTSLGDAVVASGTPRIEIRNSEFYVLGGATVWWRRRFAAEAVRISITNSVFFASAPLSLTGPRTGSITLAASHCTLLGGVFASSPDRTPMSLDLSDSLVAMRGVFPPTPGGELFPHLTLRERGNVFATRAPGGPTGEAPWRAGPLSTNADLDFGVRRRESMEVGQRLEPADFARKSATDGTALVTEPTAAGARLEYVGPGPGWNRWRQSSDAEFAAWRSAVEARLKH